MAFYFKKKKKINKKHNYAFIDSQNLNMGTQKMGWSMDWKKFRDLLTTSYDVQKAFMFIGYLPEYKALYQQLHSQGYLVVLKPTLEMLQKEVSVEEEGDSSKQDKKQATKGNVDADLVLYAVKEMANYNKAIIVSGDGDFYSLIEYLDEQHKLEKVLAPNWQFSSLLKPFASYVERLDLRRNELQYGSRYKGKHRHRTKKQAQG
jgi:uncharacterized LabA/DUF88 family protein